MSTTTPRLPTYFISHGGGPWPWMKDEMGDTYAKLEAALADMPRQIGVRPRAILMVSAHWERMNFTVQAHPQPPMVYDYGGFPPHTYSVRYDAPGDPALAARVQGLLEAAGLPAGLDAERGFDHGMFSPMKAIYPEADVPVVQLSLKKGLDPAEHLALGRVLAPLRGEGVLIIGSGLSYHNLRAFGPVAAAPSRAFDDWLQQAVVNSEPAVRTQQLIAWEQAPAARIAHPREEHLLPLMVAVGAAEAEPGQCVYHENAFMGGLTVSSFRIG
ncbi:class III extradiol ring-cleavage dioxygenase [Xenophilus arseniciresistens]|uniref:Class III extradiol ring-cleavage dioxygenase n=1 Tax=Xenophilus arseniciresistens TaxID=1283306 RepID=A0AAE3T1E1_9BURK|nr:class III extradiol ring-cleavage dioxygenase [Xenophilus arseniciresistens]MDA7417277.1 class III extradiol ring-cleavage dioxygenase [Xenophilus arseniciresistens]